MGCRVWGLGFCGLGFCVFLQRLFYPRARLWSLGFGVLGRRIWGLGLGVWGLGCRVLELLGCWFNAQSVRLAIWYIVGT